MPAKNLYKADLVAVTNTASTAVPASKAWICTVNFCNRNTTPATVRLAVCTTTTPAASEYLVYDAVVDANGTFEVTGVIADTGKYVVTYSSLANVSVNIYGFEE
jgi:hypothetical protein